MPMVRLKAWIDQFEKPLLVIAGAATLTAILMSVEMSWLEANLYDLRMTHGPEATADHGIVLVTLDDVTTNTLNQPPPLMMSTHAQFLEALEKLSPRAVGYLVDMDRVGEVSPEQLKGEWGKRFVDASRRLEQKGSPVILGTRFDVTGEVVPPFPLSTIPHSIAVIHRDGNVFAEDKVTRRALTYLYDQAVFHVELPRELGLIGPGNRPRGSYYVPEIDGQYFFFRYHGETGAPVRGGRLAYDRISFVDILHGQIDRSRIEGKIILVGPLSREDGSDYSFTPYSKKSFTNPSIVVHANILDSVIHNQGIAQTPPWADWLITFGAIALVLWWVLVFKPVHGVLATLATAVAFSFFAQIVFTYENLWIRAAQPLVGILAGYYLIVPYRLIREYKKRWDYQRKNELLVQVEELKTNFLSLVTHDLKTPVARIQGLAEVLLRKSAERLNVRDIETLNHIINSTDELNRFISSILELSKVESDHLALHLESKDINQIVERVVDGFKAQARAKMIKIETQLEPLFPIRLDAHLISKVLNNLIDNAIKYSAQSKPILIETRENGKYVEISVRDQGIGMTDDERARLFSRFYRAKNDTTARVSGTGLGLYLTRYFVEAHQGRVEIQSQAGVGTTVTILLPLEQADIALVKPLRSQRFSLVTRFKKENGHV